MRLTSYTDYALRVLLFAGAAEQSVTISNISEAYGISKDHLRKVVHSLSQLGYIKTSQGRGGGITLAKKADKISIGEVVSKLESNELVECFNNETNTCPINGMCELKRVLKVAQKSFIGTLNEYYLSDLIQNRKILSFARG